MKKKRIWLTLLAVLLCLVSTVGTAQAAWRAAAPSVHEIDLVGVQAKIVEEYTPANGVYPGNTIPKIVNVKNTGPAGCAVRVKLEPAWRDSGLPADNIHLNVNTRYWQYEPDGYYYYKGVLEPGAATLEPLLKSFTVAPETGNEYGGLSADILVKMECVQAAGGGIALWSKTFADLGIAYVPPTQQQTATKVTFIDSKEFTFAPETTDLFANFKRLLPGETRSQTIGVTNASKEAVEIFLRAEDINQSFANDAATLALVNRLLREYATIIVTDESGKVIYRGPVWGLSDPGSMADDISLGGFAAGQGKRLNVQLMLDPQMGNEYQGIMGLIKWVWSAHGAEEPPEPPTEPRDVPPGTGTTHIQGAKTWKHGSLPVDQRPESLEIIVKADGKTILTDTVTALDHWKWSFELPQYDAAGKEIAYVVEEAPLPGYTTTVDGYNVTNIHESYEEVTFAGVKAWDHSGNTGQKPQSIVVHMMDGDKAVATKRVTAEDEWTYGFSVPKYSEDGSIASYTIAEDPVPGYAMTKTDGHSMLNVYKGADYPGGPFEVPKTGDIRNVWLWAGMMAVSVALLLIVLVPGRRKRKA